MPRKKKQPVPTSEALQNLPLDVIDEPRDQVRHNINEDEMQELVNSIRAVGQIEPITVAARGDRYEIIAGHRRFIAHVILEKATIQAVVRDWSEDKIAAARLLENIDRAAMTPLEESDAIAKLAKKHKLNNKRLATILGKSEAWISQRLAIQKYPKRLKDALANKQISFSVARELIRIEDPQLMDTYVVAAINGGATPAQARRWADDAIMFSTPADEREQSNGEPATPPEPPAHTGQCWLCSGTMPFSDAHSIWLDSDCLRLVKEVARQMQDQPETQSE